MPLATAVYVMGIESGLFSSTSCRDTHCLILDENNQSFFSKKPGFYPMRHRLLFLILLAMSFLASCKTPEPGRVQWRLVRPYERIYLNDSLNAAWKFSWQVVWRICPDHPGRCNHSRQFGFKWWMRVLLILKKNEEKIPRDRSAGLCRMVLSKAQSTRQPL